MIKLPDINLAALFATITADQSSIKDAIAQASISTVVEAYAEKGADALERAVTISSEHCAELAAKLGITSDEGIAHFTEAVQAVGPCVGNIADAIITARTL